MSNKTTNLRDALRKPRPALKSEPSNKTTEQQSDTPPAKQMTVWIDGDVYEAMLLAKARGAGSFKKQINQTLRARYLSE